MYVHTNIYIVCLYTCVYIYMHDDNDTQSLPFTSIIFFYKRASWFNMSGLMFMTGSEVWTGGIKMCLGYSSSSFFPLPYGRWVDLRSSAMLDSLQLLGGLQRTAVEAEPPKEDGVLVHVPLVLLRLSSFCIAVGVSRIFSVVSSLHIGRKWNVKMRVVMTVVQKVQKESS